LLPEGRIDPIGVAQGGDLFGAEAKLGVLEPDQDRIARQRLQQQEGGGEGDPEDEQRLSDPACDVARHWRRSRRRREAPDIAARDGRDQWAASQTL
jgi:hypothetical protein